MYVSGRERTKEGSSVVIRYRILISRVKKEWVLTGINAVGEQLEDMVLPSVRLSDDGGQNQVRFAHVPRDKIRGPTAVSTKQRASCRVEMEGIAAGCHFDLAAMT